MRARESERAIAKKRAREQGQERGREANDIIVVIWILRDHGTKMCKAYFRSQLILLSAKMIVYNNVHMFNEYV